MLSDDLRALREEFVLQMDRNACIEMNFDMGLELIGVLRLLEQDAACLEQAIIPRELKTPMVRPGGNVVLLRPRHHGRRSTPPAA